MIYKAIRGIADKEKLNKSMWDSIEGQPQLFTILSTYFCELMAVGLSFILAYSLFSQTLESVITLMSSLGS